MSPRTLSYPISTSVQVSFAALERIMSGLVPRALFFWKRIRVITYVQVSEILDKEGCRTEGFSRRSSCLETGKVVDWATQFRFPTLSLDFMIS